MVGAHSSAKVPHGVKVHVRGHHLGEGIAITRHYVHHTTYDESKVC